MQTAEFIEALQRAEAYADPPRGGVGMLQTHISMLFFTDDRVFKVKKAITLDFLDYSTLERRQHFCQEEVRLNRRLAPQVYLGVVPIVRTVEGTIRVNGAGETIEYAVEMVRLPRNRMLNAVLERGEIDNQQIDALAELLARFHREAATGAGVDAFGEPAEIAKQVEENLEELRAFTVGDDAAPRLGAATLSSTLRDHLHVAAQTWLHDHLELLDRRVDEGRVRDGHGDLHAGNICLTPDAILIYDCIEFSPRYRCRDVACELAFLAMDLDLRCFRGFAQYLLRRYAELTADPELPMVAAFYKMHLAMVRGKVASLRAADARFGAADRDAARLEAMGYLHLAGAYTLPPALILMCGLPATGKSHAARAIARPFEAVVLRSDVVRKELAGLAPQARGAGDLDAGFYTPEFTQRTYAALLERAKEHLVKEKTVIVDATFSTASMRKPFFTAAHGLGVDCVLVEMTCPEHIVRQRLERRVHDVEEASDADWAVYRHARERFETPEEVPATQRVRCDARRSPEECVGAVLDQMIRCR